QPRGDRPNPALATAAAGCKTAKLGFGGKALALNDPRTKLSGWRLQTWNDPSQSLRSGKWVAVIERDGSDNTADAPVLYPDLPPGQQGCVFFKDYDDPSPIGRYASAWYQDQENHPPRRMPQALICYHKDPHPNDPDPTNETAADQCPEGAFAVGSF